MSHDATRQSIIDEEHLKLLSLGYLISGIMSALAAGLGMMYASVVGIGMRALLQTTHAASGQPPPAFIGWILAAVGISIFLALAGMAVAKFYTVKFLKARKFRVFCMIVAAFTCLDLPYGTILGVCSFLVLSRNSVIRMFEPIPTSTPPEPPGAVSRT